MKTTIKFGVDAHTKTYTTTPTIGMILEDQNLRAVMGYGDNVWALVNGVEQPSETLVPDESVVVIETRANSKAAPDITITIRYGVDSHTRSVPGPVTVGEILDDEDLRAALGYGDNVRALINGVEQPEDAGLYHGSTLVIETKANCKAG